MRVATRLSSLLVACTELQGPSGLILERDPGLERARSGVRVESQSTVDGRGLVATRALGIGELVSLYPMHALRAAHDDDDRDRDRGGDRLPLDTDVWYATEEERAWFLANEVEARRFRAAGAGGAVTIDVCPLRPLNPLFAAHFVNDAAALDETCSFAEAALAYTRSSVLGANAAIVDFGPAPVLAYVTTRPVDAGAEILTTYGAEYWLEQRGASLDALDFSKVAHSLAYSERKAQRTRAAAQLAVRENYASSIALVTESLWQSLRTPCRCSL